MQGKKRNTTEAVHQSIPDIPDQLCCLQFFFLVANAGQHLDSTWENGLSPISPIRICLWNARWSFQGCGNSAWHRQTKLPHPCEKLQTALRSPLAFENNNTLLQDRCFSKRKEFEALPVLLPISSSTAPCCHAIFDMLAKWDWKIGIHWTCLQESGMRQMRLVLDILRVHPYFAPWQSRSSVLFLVRWDPSPEPWALMRLLSSNMDKHTLPVKEPKLPLVREKRQGVTRNKEWEKEEEEKRNAQLRFWSSLRRALEIQFRRSSSKKSAKPELTAAEVPSGLVTSGTCTHCLLAKVKDRQAQLPNGEMHSGAQSDTEQNAHQVPWTAMLHNISITFQHVWRDGWIAFATVQLGGECPTYGASNWRFSTLHNSWARTLVEWWAT